MTYISLFEERGFQVTDDSSLEQGYEKIALYIRENEFQHVARQLADGRWTSKIGGKEDISHNLDELNTDRPHGYGQVEILMRREI